jgi:hypothetical protein
MRKNWLRFNTLHGSEAFTGKASKGDVVVLYFELWQHSMGKPPVRPKGEI